MFHLQGPDRFYILLRPSLITINKHICKWIAGLIRSCTKTGGGQTKKTAINHFLCLLFGFIIFIHSQVSLCKQMLSHILVCTACGLTGSIGFRTKTSRIGQIGPGKQQVLFDQCIHFIQRCSHEICFRCAQWFFYYRYFTKTSGQRIISIGPEKTSFSIHRIFLIIGHTGQCGVFHIFNNDIGVIDHSVCPAPRERGSRISRNQRRIIVIRYFNTFLLACISNISSNLPYI